MRVARGAGSVEERVVGKAVEQRGLLHDLEDRVLDWWRVCTREGIQVQADDGDPIRELFCQEQ